MALQPTQLSFPCIMSEWQTKELATAFLKGVRGAIPGADLQLAVIRRIIQFWCEAPPRILDLGCGDGILGHFLLDAFPTSRCVFVDFSDPMLDAAREKVSSIQQTCVLKADFATPQWLDSVASYKPFDVVVSGFAIHHQTDDRKKTLYAEIYDLLSTGGVFLNLEHVTSYTPAGERLFNEFFVDHLHGFHAKSEPEASREKIADTY